MKLSSYFNDVEKGKSRTSWTWPPFKPHKIISCATKCETMKNVKSVTCDSTGKSAADCCLPTRSKDSVGELVEMATKALKSNRLFFQPGSTSSILEAAKYRFENCVTVSIDSDNPYWDFRNSMEEMVEAYGLKRWEHLEELLALYLRMNTRKNHDLIIDAFIDISIISSSFSNRVACSSSKTKRLVGHRA